MQHLTPAPTCFTESQREAGRFLAKVTSGAHGCLLWTGSTDGKGYGMFRSTNRTVRAHRWLYEKLVGEIPAGAQLDHLCKVRNCVSPWHLEAVSPRENWIRSDALTVAYAKSDSCKQGHKLAGANLRLRTRGARQTRECVTCHRRWQTAYARRKNGPPKHHYPTKNDIT